VGEGRRGDGQERRASRGAWRSGGWRARPFQQGPAASAGGAAPSSGIGEHGRSRRWAGAGASGLGTAGQQVRAHARGMRVPGAPRRRAAPAGGTGRRPAGGVARVAASRAAMADPTPHALITARHRTAPAPDTPTQRLERGRERSGGACRPPGFRSPGRAGEFAARGTADAPGRGRRGRPRDGAGRRHVRSREPRRAEGPAQRGHGGGGAGVTRGARAQGGAGVGARQGRAPRDGAVLRRRRAQLPGPQQVRGAGGGARRCCLRAAGAGEGGAGRGLAQARRTQRWGAQRRGGAARRRGAALPSGAGPSGASGACRCRASRRAPAGPAEPHARRPTHPPTTAAAPRSLAYAALTFNRDNSFGPDVYSMGASLFFVSICVFSVRARPRGGALRPSAAPQRRARDPWPQVLRAGTQLRATARLTPPSHHGPSPLTASCPSPSPRPPRYPPTWP
jgi:hypothetical protein